MVVKYEFQLTGSHFFGGATIDSDIDFFAQYNPWLKKQLLCLGFVEQPLDYDFKCKRNIICLLKHPIFNIHIQLVRSFAIKQRCQKALTKFGFGNVLKNKIAAKHLWALCNELTLED